MGYQTKVDLDKALRKVIEYYQNAGIILRTHRPTEASP